MPLKESILPSTLGPVDILRLSFYSKAPSTSVVAVNIAKLVNFLRLIFGVGFELQFGPKQKKIYTSTNYVVSEFMIFCAERGCQIMQIRKSLFAKSLGKISVKAGGE